MSCWVVPAVAAEFWGVSVETVLHRVRAGQLPFKSEKGFLFVDVAPWSLDFAGVRHTAPPPTFTAGDAQDGIGDDGAACERARAETIDSDGNEPVRRAEPEEEPLLAELDDEEAAEFGRLSWEETRRQVARRRRPPIAA